MRAILISSARPGSVVSVQYYHDQQHSSRPSLEPTQKKKKNSFYFFSPWFVLVFHLLSFGVNADEWLLVRIN
jgi:hypothetical protein